MVRETWYVKARGGCCRFGFTVTERRQVRRRQRQVPGAPWDISCSNRRLVCSRFDSFALGMAWAPPPHSRPNKHEREQTRHENEHEKSQHASGCQQRRYFRLGCTNLWFTWQQRNLCATPALPWFTKSNDADTRINRDAAPHLTKMI